MIGAIAGDIIGSRFEWNNHRSRDFDLFHDTLSMFTDDTVLTPIDADIIGDDCSTPCPKQTHLSYSIS